MKWEVAMAEMNKKTAGQLYLPNAAEQSSITNHTTSLWFIPKPSCSSKAYFWKLLKCCFPVSNPCHPRLVLCEHMPSSIVAYAPQQKGMGAFAIDFLMGGDSVVTLKLLLPN